MTKRILAALMAVPVMGLAAQVALADAPPNPTPPQLFSGNNGDPNSSGSAVRVNEGHGGQAAVLTSNGVGYAIANAPFPGHKTTFSQLTNLSTDYELTRGTCAGGSPRFQVDLLPPGDKNLNDAVSLFVYIGPGAGPAGDPCPAANGSLQNQANVASDSQPNLWYVGAANTGMPYSAAEAAYGSYQLLDVQIAVDGGWAQSGNTQQVLVQDWQVNGRNFFPLPGEHGDG